MFIRFAGGGTAVFYDLCVIVRVVDVYLPPPVNLININNPNNNT
jgi:hypothetical protein